MAREPAPRSRTRRSSSSGGGKFFFYLVLLGGLGAGGYFGWPHISKFLEKKKPGREKQVKTEPAGKKTTPPAETGIVTTAPPPVETPIAKPVEPAPVPVPGPASRTGKDDSFAKQTLAEARRSIGAFAFQKARSLLHPLANKDLSRGVEKDVRGVLAEAEDYYGVTRGITPRARQKIMLVTLTSRAKRTCLAVNVVGDSYELVLLSGVKIKLPVESIDTIRELSAAEITERLKKRLSGYENLFAQAGKVGPAEFCYLANEARKLNLTGEALRYLKKARAMSPRQSLRVAVAEGKAQRLLDLALYYDAASAFKVAKSYYRKVLQKYPDTKVAAEAKGKLAALEGRRAKVKPADLVKKKVTVAKAPLPVDDEEEPEAGGVVEVPKIISIGTGSVKEMVDKANALFEKGRASYLKGRPGPGNQNYSKHLKKAREYLQQAGELFSNAFDKCKDARLDKQAEAAYRMLHHALKMAPVN